MKIRSYADCCLEVTGSIKESQRRETWYRGSTIVVVALDLVFRWPTAVTLIFYIVSVLPDEDGYFIGDDAAPFFKLLIFEIVLRSARVLAVLLHELSHLFAAAVILNSFCAPPKGRRLNSALLFAFRLCRDSTLEAPFAMPLQRWLLLQLLPGSYAPAVRIVLSLEGLQALQHAGPWASNIIELTGLFTSFLLPYLMLPNLEHVLLIQWPAFFGVMLPIAGALLSDMRSGSLPGCSQPFGCFACGNWGCLVPREALNDKRESKKLLPNVCIRLMTGILDIVELRGAQAGGAVTYVARGKEVVAVRSRIVKPPRKHLATLVFKKMEKELRWQSLVAAARLQIVRPLPVILVQGHSRFGTSSLPSTAETHPHQWLGPHLEHVWQRDPISSMWVRSTCRACISITHNGDFVGFHVYESLLSLTELNIWLSFVLHCKNDAECDSAKLAGLMDLLACKGQWHASVRLGFVFGVMQHVDEACGWADFETDANNVVPDAACFKAWARIFDNVFARIVKASPKFEPHTEAVRSLAEEVARSFADERAARGVMGSEASDKFRTLFLAQHGIFNFCYYSCRAFFENDLMSAVWHFFGRAVGEFGVSVSSTLSPDKIVIASKGQPMSLAFDIHRPIVLWASEPESLTLRWPGLEQDFKMASCARWDLLSANGEVVEIKVVAANWNCDTSAQEHLDGFLADDLVGTRLECAQYFAPGKVNSKQARRHHIFLRGASLDDDHVPLSAKSFASRWIALRRPFALPPKPYVSNGQLDPVASDLREVPFVLAEIDESWSDRNSLNRRSGKNFTTCLSFLLQNRLMKTTYVDVLIYGIENSLWLGQQFAADLAKVFPRLNVLCMSSNELLALLQEYEGHMALPTLPFSWQRLEFSQHAVVLAISQSGGTYPTVWVTRKLNCNPVPLHIFTLSGQFETLLSNTIGQDIHTCEFLGRAFSTLSGVRPCEPSTLATLAMHHTLTKLFQYCVERAVLIGKEELTASEADVALPICELQANDVTDLQHLVNRFQGTAETLCGVTAWGAPVSSEVRDQLLETGKYVSSHLTEWYFSMIIAVFYVYVGVTFGISIFASGWSAIKSRFGFAEDDEETRVMLFLQYFVSHLDAHLYVFAAALVVMARRHIAGRRLWIRHRERTLVILDSTLNHKLVEAYLSKLSSLAFSLFNFRVKGCNQLDHFLHEMQHLAANEVMLFLGRPDGRLATHATSEATSLRAVQQLIFSDCPSRNVEAMSIGHNPFKLPWMKRNVVIPTSLRPTFLSSRLLKTEEGPHSPFEVIPRVAYLARGKVNSTVIFPRISMEELTRRMGTYSNAGDDNFLSFDRAAELIEEIVEEQQAELGIPAAKFRAAAILPKDLSALSGRGALGPRGINANNAFGRLRTVIMPKALPGPSMKRSFSAKSEKSDTSQLESNTSTTSTTTSDAAVLSAPEVMSLLRGSAMQKEILKLRTQIHSHTVLQIAVKASFADCWNCDSRAADDLKRHAFRIWNMNTNSRVVETMERVIRYFRRSDTRWNGWRTNEGFRCFFARRKILGRVGEPKLRCFAAWKHETHFARSAGRAAPSKRKALPVINNHLLSKMTSCDFMENMRLVEMLYESRVAAAERLLAFFVMFHSAVQPMSRLPGFSFSMDRTQSRLRIASTPSPVAFIEELPAHPVFLSAVLRVQRTFRRKQRGSTEYGDMRSLVQEIQRVSALEQMRASSNQRNSTGPLMRASYNLHAPPHCQYNNDSDEDMIDLPDEGPNLKLNLPRRWPSAGERASNSKLLSPSPPTVAEKLLVDCGYFEQQLAAAATVQAQF